VLEEANGQLIQVAGQTVGSSIIGQRFSGAGDFHSRPSSGGNGYAGVNSNGSQLGPTSRKLINRVRADVALSQADNPSLPVPIDLVTTSPSGLDPNITPAAAEFQLLRVAGSEALPSTVCAHSWPDTQKAGNGDFWGNPGSMCWSSIWISSFL
jgi:potassium-transporting ATPase KdpC subunit